MSDDFKIIKFKAADLKDISLDKCIFLKWYIENQKEIDNLFKEYIDKEWEYRSKPGKLI